MNPRKMKQMMEQMGIDVDELDATEVVIRLEDGSELVFDDADVTRMDARGQETYQVIGEPEERESTAGEVEAGETDGESGGIPEDDVELVAARAGVSAEEAREALEATGGDLAAAIDRVE
ncbi:nascent polypeptide-associated complex protein [Salarchaeum japonicum]|uniref:Nascent polypeptide-associated complex protein n=2 Tax=Salarchaeum japonicum TaxID=555573 RepID=A0AAV3T2Q5_9EURY